MTDYDNEMRGVLFPNDKGDNPNRPDHRGEVTIGGTKYSLSVWAKTSKAGKDFMSISVQPWQDRPAQNNSAQQAQQPLDDSIPF